MMSSILFYYNLFYSIVYLVGEGLADSSVALQRDGEGEEDAVGHGHVGDTLAQRDDFVDQPPRAQNLEIYAGFRHVQMIFLR